MHPTDIEQAPAFVRRRPAIGAAYDFAARCHLGQRRESDEASFIVHPLEVGALLDGVGSPEDEIVAGVLHDVLEKTAATPEEVRLRFGDRVADLVIALTEDSTIEPFAARKAALTAQIAAGGPAAAAISAADKVAKVGELRARIAAANTPAGGGDGPMGRSDGPVGGSDLPVGGSDLPVGGSAGRGTAGGNGGAAGGSGGAAGGSGGAAGGSGGLIEPSDAGRKRAYYAASLASLESQIPGHPLVQRFRVELELLDVLRGGP